MAGKHIVLVVEDNPKMRTIACEMLESFGYETIAVGSQAEAEPIIASGGFCAAVYDLKLPARPDSAVTSVDIGHALIESTRKRNPGRNARDKNHLQIIVMSGHAKEPHFVSRVHQEGANDFVVKPITEHKIPFRDVMRQAFRHSGRESHDDCERTNELARGAGAFVSVPISHGVVSERAASEPRFSRRKRFVLSVSGEERKKYSVVEVAGKTGLVANASFVILVKLIAARVAGDQGWVHKSDLGATADHGWPGPTRLRNEMKPLLGAKRDPLDFDNSGNYRLDPKIELGRVNWKQLAVHSDPRVREEAEGVLSGRRAPGR